MIPTSENTSYHSFVCIVLSGKDNACENAPASAKSWITLNWVPLSKIMAPFEKSITSPNGWPGPNDWPGMKMLPAPKSIGTL